MKAHFHPCVPIVVFMTLPLSNPSLSLSLSAHRFCLFRLLAISFHSSNDCRLLSLAFCSHSPSIPMFFFVLLDPSHFYFHTRSLLFGGLVHMLLDQETVVALFRVLDMSIRTKERRAKKNKKSRALTSALQILLLEHSLVDWSNTDSNSTRTGRIKEERKRSKRRRNTKTRGHELATVYYIRLPFYPCSISGSCYKSCPCLLPSFCLSTLSPSSETIELAIQL